MTERSILAAVSGIDSNQTWIDSIGNNIANADTVGYKDSEVQFQDLLAEELSGGTAPTATSGGIDPVAVGSGVQVAGNDVNLSEGSLENTGNSNDVAIEGNGYLVVENGGQQYYTRDGALTTDASGNLTTESGDLIQGWQANSSGTINTNAPLSSIKIPTGETIPATATSTISLSGNLPAWSGSGTATPQTVTTNAYDSLGNKVAVTLTFTPVSGTAGAWTVQGSYTDPSTGSSVNLWSTAPTVTFYPDTSPNAGELDTVNGTTVPPGSATTLATDNSPTGGTLDLSFPADTSSDGVTQYSANASIEATQNGYASGTLTGYSVGDNGVITGTFSNGATLSLGQIALSAFSNAGGLTDNGGGLYSASPNSGQALVGTAGTGGRGTLLGGELEQSNVDLGSELTELITAQEAYTANTKTLNTSSQVIQALENVQ